jgi:hypothetical protein
MKKVAVLVLLFVHTVILPSVASAQDDRMGLTFGVQTGFEYLSYTETSDFEGTRGEYGGSSTAIVATASIEYDLKQLLELPLFVAVTAGFPIVSFAGEDRFVQDLEEGRFLTQTNKGDHEYTMFRAFAGYKFKPVFQPFVMFERALFQSTRWDLRKGTSEGNLELVEPNVTWHERVWSSHIGGGFQGGLPLDPEKLFTAKFRVAMLLPIASFVTNDHPAVNSTDGSIGQNADGVSIFSRIAVHYDWHERSSVHLGLNWYYRRWDETRTVNDGKEILWPANDMDAFPVLLGVTWSI